MFPALEGSLTTSCLSLVTGTIIGPATFKLSDCIHVQVPEIVGSNPAQGSSAFFFGISCPALSASIYLALFTCTCICIHSGVTSLL